ncbi:MAG: NADH-quinone oxidoreductase subunit L [Pirellulaceae bacterium]|nr:NADH-quinone oxidoreductase subunit L [Pirellulaceae bacterium]
MEPSALPLLLGLATLLPLASFFVLLVFGPRFGKALGHGAYVATGAIVGAGVLAFASLFIWLGNHPIVRGQDSGPESETHVDASDAEHSESEGHEAKEEHEQAGHSAHGVGPAYAGDYYTLGVFGKLRLTIGYYIDSLTIIMFCLVTLIASCIHFYAMGYMHEEVDDVVTDHEVTLKDGSHLKRRGRHSRFFQYMSLFCFSMLGLVLAGNVAMVFVFWELVGICSYFLIGFYIERRSACVAANKAFIVNRVGDFGMIIGLMALWTGLGTLSFGDVKVMDADGHEHIEKGVFSLVRPEERGHAIRTPDGLVKLDSRVKIAETVRSVGLEQARGQIEADVDEWRHDNKWEDQGGSWTFSWWRKFREWLGSGGRGYWLLIVAGIGIFCGCVGKSAQFPLHTWLPDAMEGPTPVSALVHSATMVAAGVYLVGRFFPVFTPEVLLVIAVTGCITLFMAATIAITATDIKRVLAYSTVSQLGYMMLALGVGGWIAGLLHLITHAFFKSLLFLCSGSVIHAVHTNEMPEMGGLRKKMPITATTMLIGCLAIAGISLPFIIGFSGYYSKDRILEQAYVFMGENASWLASVFFYAAAGGAAVTAFYMFRLWYMTFAGKPRNQHRYDHAHESPKVMWVPLVVLAFFATTVAWPWFGLVDLLEQSRPAGTLADTTAVLANMEWPNEHLAHEPRNYDSVVVPVTLLATVTALAGIALATVMYLFGGINPDEVRRQFRAIHRFLLNKWWFDELYDFIFVRPTHVIARLLAAIDRKWIDGLIDGTANVTRRFATIWEWATDQTVVDGFVNTVARWTYAVGVWLRVFQTGKLRQYVMFIVIGAIAIFVLISFFWSPSVAG